MKRIANEVNFITSKQRINNYVEMSTVLYSTHFF